MAVVLAYGLLFKELLVKRKDCSQANQSVVRMMAVEAGLAKEVLDIIIANFRPAHKELFFSIVRYHLLTFEDEQQKQ